MPTPAELVTTPEVLRVVRGTARRLVRGSQVDDLVGEVALRLVARAHRFDPALATVTTWAAMLTRSTAIDGWRRHYREKAGLEAFGREPPREAHTGATAEEVDRLRDALAGMSPAAREVAVLRAREVPFTGIALGTGVSAGTAKSASFRGRAELRDRIEAASVLADHGRPGPRRVAPPVLRPALPAPPAPAMPPPPADPERDLARRFREACGDRPARVLGALLGVHPETTRRWSLGSATIPASAVARLCVTLNVSPSWLLLGIGPVVGPGASMPPVLRTPTGRSTARGRAGAFP